jgi:hypothetical protein
LRSLSGLHVALRPYAEAAVKWAEDQGVHVEITSVTRTWTNQLQLYNNWELCKAAGKQYTAASLTQGMSCEYPANPPGYSAHNYGLAWDSVVDAELQDWWDAVRKWYGWEIPANDRIHAQLPNWEQYADPRLLM